jgi:TRAP-type C4-dicarboxylate transport system permease large subunit
MRSGGRDAGGSDSAELGFIVNALVTEESMGELFIACLVPGTLLVVLFMVLIYIAAVRNPEMASGENLQPSAKRFLHSKRS